MCAESEREREREHCTVRASAVGIAHSGMCVQLREFYFLITSLFLGRQPEINYLQLLFLSPYLCPCAASLSMRTPTVDDVSVHGGGGGVATDQRSSALLTAHECERYTY